jgi:phosphoglycolate phosphatase-like HAD superfamily hydrolase
MIGNERRDIEAGRKAGCRTVLVNGSAGTDIEPKPTAAVKSFTDAVRTILRNTPHEVNGVSRANKPTQTSVASARTGSGAITSSIAPNIAGTAATEAAQSTHLAVRELIDELRSERRMRSEFTALRMAAGAAQLVAVLLALLGIMQIAQSDVFFKWMLGAVLLQLMTIALLVLDWRR